MKFRLATWNINSARLRLALIQQFIGEFSPDVLCLQEIKCRDEHFPCEALAGSGLPHIEINGQAGYHGVATLSRWPLRRLGTENFCGTGEARHLAVAAELDGLAPVTIHNLYVPSGGDLADAEENPKFRQKLKFLDVMAGWFADRRNQDDRMLLAGDLNVAPLENDVWSHKQLLKVVSHTPAEVEHLARVQASCGWIDTVRQHFPADRKVFTWWSYRAQDWRTSNRGRRLDHIWSTPDIAGLLTDIKIADTTRDWPQSSDHVPVIADFEL